MKIKLPSGQIVSQAQAGFKPKQIRTMYSSRLIRGLGQETTFNPPDYEEEVMLQIGGESRIFKSRPATAQDIEQLKEALEKYKQAGIAFQDWRSSLLHLRDLVFVRWTNFIRTELPQIVPIEKISPTEMAQLSALGDSLGKLYEESGKYYDLASREYEQLAPLVEKMRIEYGLGNLGDPFPILLAIVIIAICTAIITTGGVILAYKYINIPKETVDTVIAPYKAAIGIEEERVKTLKDLEGKRLDGIKSAIERLDLVSKEVRDKEYPKLVTELVEDPAKVKKQMEESRQAAERILEKQAEAEKRLPEIVKEVKPTLLPDFTKLIGEAGAQLVKVVLVGGGVYLAIKFLPRLLEKKQPAPRVAPQVANIWGRI